MYFVWGDVWRMLMTGGELQQQTIEPKHIDHSSHFYWGHAYMWPVYGMVVVALIAGAVKIYCNRKNK